MDVRNTLNKRKYLLRIYFIVSIAVLVLIMAYSAIAYSRVKTKLFDDEVNNGKKILIQMKNNIRSIDGIVRGICLSNYYDFDIRSLMFLKEKDTYTETHAQTQLIRSIITNSFFHSIYIYNNNRKVYFSTTDPFYHEDKLLDDKLKSLSSIPVLKPILRNIETTTPSGIKVMEQVISYCYYERSDSNKNMDGAIIVNIKIDWLLSNIKEISSVEQRETEHFFLASANGDILKEEGISNQFNPDISEIMESFHLTAGNNNAASSMGDDDETSMDGIAGTSTRIVDGKKYLFTYLDIQQGNFILFKVNSYDEIYNTADSFRILFFIMTLSFLLIGFVATMGVSRVIYRPVAGILNHVRTSYLSEETKEESTDEISFIKNTISRSMEKLEKLKIEKYTNSRIMKTYFLKRLLLESAAIGMDELRNGFAEHGVLLNPEGCYAAFLLKIDRYKDFRRTFSQTDAEHIKTITMEHISQIISVSFICEVLDTQEDQITVIINSPSEESNFYSKMGQLLEKINHYTNSSHAFTFSASVSEISNRYTDIHNLNNRAGINLMYRYVFGRQSLITPFKVAHNNRLPGSNKNLESEEGFFKAMREGDWQQSEEYLSRFFDELRDVNCIGVMFYATHLTNELRNIVFSINEHRDKPINVGHILSGEGLQEIETLQDLYKQIIHLLEEFKSLGENNEDRKFRILADTIKDIIDSNYQNPELNITFIENLVKLSPSYIGKAFNMHIKMSVPEYVNDVRMVKAVEWLQNSKLSINQVMQKVGIENQSYFYRLFKNKYGSTPREYIQRI